MKSRLPFLPRPFNLSRGTERGTRINFLEASICAVRRTMMPSTANNEPKRGSGTRAALLRVHRNCELGSDAEAEPDMEEFG